MRVPFEKQRQPALAGNTDRDPKQRPHSRLPGGSDEFHQPVQRVDIRQSQLPIAHGCRSVYQLCRSRDGLQKAEMTVGAEQ